MCYTVCSGIDVASQLNPTQAAFGSTDTLELDMCICAVCYSVNDEALLVNPRMSHALICDAPCIPFVALTTLSAAGTLPSESREARSAPKSTN